MIAYRATGGRLGEAVAAMRDVIVQPQLRRAEVAFLLACTSESAFTVGLGVLAYRDGGPVGVGVVAVIRMVPSALASPLVSAVADRMRRERVLAMVSAFRAVAIGVAALLAARDDMVGVYVLSVLATIAFTVFRPAHSALLPTLCTTTRELTSANVVRGVLDAAGALTGPALAGLLLAVGDPTAVFVAVAALSGGAAAVLVRIRYETVVRTTAVHLRSLGRDTVEGLRAVAGHPDLVLLFALGFAQTAVRGALNVFVVVVALELFTTGDAGVAVLSAAVGIGGVLGSLGVSLLVGSRHLGAWLAVALVLWGAPIAIIGLVPSVTASFVLLAVVGLGNAIIDVPFFTLPVRLADDAVLARAFGVFESLVALGVAVGSLVTPLLIAQLGLRDAVIAVGLVLPVLAALCWRRLTALDRRLGVREDEIAVLRGAPMLRQLPVARIEHLATRLQHRRIPAGAAVFEQGDLGDAFFVIVRGEAEVVGDGTPIRTLGPGDSFGEIALIRDSPRTATVCARDELDLFELGRDAFLDAIGAHGPSTDAAHAVVARRLANYAPAPVGP